jgi:hypothetical protein
MGGTKFLNKTVENIVCLKEVLYIISHCVQFCKMEQYNLIDAEADAALESLLQLAMQCSKNMDTTRTLVMKALSHPTIFSGFDQLNAALEIPSDHVLWRTLNLFSYGNVSDYMRAEPGHFINLTENQIFKLRQLSVLSIIQKSCFEASSVIPYTSLQNDFDGNNQVESIEELLVSCIFAGLFAGKLCQKTQCFYLSCTVPIRSRDVPISQSGYLLERLTSFRNKVDETLSKMAHAKEDVKLQREGHENFWQTNTTAKGIDINKSTFGSLTDRNRNRSAFRASNKRSRGVGLPGTGIF